MRTKRKTHSHNRQTDYRPTQVVQVSSNLGSGLHRLIWLSIILLVILTLAIHRA